MRFWVRQVSIMGSPLNREQIVNHGIVIVYAAKLDYTNGMIEVEQLSERLKLIDAEIEKLQVERDEIGVALRVLGRLSKPPKPPPQPPPKAAAKVPKKAKLVPRPAGIPSTFDMVEAILTEGEATGKPELTSRELMDKIREKYWPGVQNKQILPSIFGFAPKRLIREGDKWKRKHNLFG